MSTSRTEIVGRRAIHTEWNTAYFIDLGVAANDKSFKSSSSDTEDESKAEEFVSWGSSNDHPVKLIEKAEFDTVITPGIRFKAELQYGGGVSHGTIEVQENGKEFFVPRRDREIVSFFRRNQIGKQILTNLYDLSYFNVAFSLVGFSNDGRKITRYNGTMLRAKNVRLGRINKYGQIENIFFNPDFGTSEYTEEKTVKYDVVPDYGAEEWMREKKRTAAVFIHKLPDSGRQYYPMADWQSADNSKWMDISKTIAVFKKNLMDNQFTIKYHIKVHPRLWEKLYSPEVWQSLDPSEKEAKQREWVEGFVDFFKSKEGKGSSIVTEKYEHPGIEGKLSDMVEIEEISGKYDKDGTYIEDSKEASEHKISALGLHPDIVGASPGSNFGSGSGSGNRVAFNQRVAMAKSTQDMVLSPFYAIAEFNGWDPEIEFRFRESLITTLDTGASATKPKAEA